MSRPASHAQGRRPALAPAAAAHRALLILAWHEEGLTFRAIAQRLGVSPDHATHL